MVRRIFIHVVCCFALLQISGCGNEDTKQTENSASENQPTEKLALTPTESVQSGLDGYKSFKFGLNSNEILKLPECVTEYQQKVNEVKGLLTENEPKLVRLKEQYDVRVKEQNEVRAKEQLEITANGAPAWVKDNQKKHEELTKQIVNLETDLTAVEERVAAGHLDSREWTQLRQEQSDIEHNIRDAKKELDSVGPLVYVTTNIDNIEIERLETNITTLKKIIEFSQESADEWFKEGHTCQIQIFNEPATLHPQFEAGKLAAVVIELGGFNNDKFQAIVKSLADKYSVSHTYTDEQQASFNQLQLRKISVTFASGQVSLVAVNTSKINFIGGFKFENAYTTTDRVMVLQYFDLKHAALAEKESTKGEVTGNDL